MVSFNSSFFWGSTVTVLLYGWSFGLGLLGGWVDNDCSGGGSIIVGNQRSFEASLEV